MMRQAYAIAIGLAVAFMAGYYVRGFDSPDPAAYVSVDGRPPGYVATLSCPGYAPVNVSILSHYRDDELLWTVTQAAKIGYPPDCTIRPF